MKTEQLKTTARNLIDWRDALLSGNFDQAQKRFIKFDLITGEPEAYCCLGVAYNAVFDNGPDYDFSVSRERYVTSKFLLEEEEHPGIFVKLNDDLKLSFTQIADIILEKGIKPCLEVLGEDLEDWLPEEV